MFLASKKIPSKLSWEYGITSDRYDGYILKYCNLVDADRRRANDIKFETNYFLQEINKSLDKDVKPEPVDVENQGGKKYNLLKEINKIFSICYEDLKEARIRLSLANRMITAQCCNILLDEQKYHNHDRNCERIKAGAIWDESRQLCLLPGYIYHSNPISVNPPDLVYLKGQNQEIINTETLLGNDLSCPRPKESF